jgi:hypothetical protein
VLHHVLPLAFRVVIPGRSGQLADGIGAGLARLSAGHRELVGGRQVAEPDRHARAQCVTNKMVISASCTSEGIRVSSSTRVIWPPAMARITGLGTSASRDGPSAISRA